MDDKATSKASKHSPPRTPTYSSNHTTTDLASCSSSHPHLRPRDASPDVVDNFFRLSLGEENVDDKTLVRRESKPHSQRPSSSPLPSPPLQPAPLPRQPRARSPYSRPHLRTQSSVASLTAAPPLLRAHSSPASTSPPPAFLPLARSSSPLRSPTRTRSPFRLSSDETFLASSIASDIESIDENHELDITPRPAAPSLALGLATSSDCQQSLPLYHGNTFPRSRRRPASPLHQVSSLSFTMPIGAPASASHSPLFLATKFNEPLPPDLSYSRSSSTLSSMPSTPTSTRSRSPSILSLETIPDTPDEEQEAIEADQLDRLRRAADASDSFKRVSLDGGRGGAGFGSRDKRKRWSVCGAEKRGDLNLETIWED